MVDRIATFSQTQTLSRELMRLQAEYAKTSEQESSSLKSTNYQGIADDSFELLQLQSTYSLLIGQTETLQTSLNRIEVMYSVIGSMTDLISSALSDLNTAISSSTSDAATIFSGYLDEFASLLNTQLAGRYLFGGAVTDTAPVDVSSLPSLTSPTVADTSYYLGDSTLASTSVSSSLSITYGVTGDSSAFEQAIRAFQLVVSDPSNNTALAEAYDLLQSSLTEVSSLQSSLSTKATLLDNQINESTEDMNLLDSMISDLRDSDLSEITIKINELETQLEAAYAISSKFLNLKLVDYL